MKTIAVLALQGAFEEHKSALQALDCNVVEIRQEKDLYPNKMDGLIIPGGESTVIGRLLKELNLFYEVKARIKAGLPVFGTCAGLILLAKEIANDSNRYLEAMDITAKRNAYGRQLGSFQTEEVFEGIGKIPMTFIRAPYIEAVKEDQGVEILAKVNDKIVAAKQNNILVTAFHPELTKDISVHRYFLQMIKAQR